MVFASFSGVFFVLIQGCQEWCSIFLFYFLDQYMEREKTTIFPNIHVQVVLAGFRTGKCLQVFHPFLQSN
jgi:hypothetical protein